MRESANPIDYFIIESDARDNKKNTLEEGDREREKRVRGAEPKTETQTYSEV